MFIFIVSCRNRMGFVFYTLNFATSLPISTLKRQSTKFVCVCVEYIQYAWILNNTYLTTFVMKVYIFTRK